MRALPQNFPQDARAIRGRALAAGCISAGGLERTGSRDPRSTPEPQRPEIDPANGYPRTGSGPNARPPYHPTDLSGATIPRSETPRTQRCPTPPAHPVRPVRPVHKQRPAAALALAAILYIFPLACTPSPDDAESDYDYTEAEYPAPDYPDDEIGAHDANPDEPPNDHRLGPPKGPRTSADATPATAADFEALRALPRSTVAEYAPASPPPLSSDDWDEVTGRGPFERKGLPEPREPLPSLDPGIADALGTIAWIAVVGLLVGALAYLLYRRSKRPDHGTTRRDYGAADELLSASADDLATGLADNLDGGDYREAIRLRFGQVLQALRTRGLLVWVPGHTNAEYEAALPAALRGPFAGLSREFSYATYAGREVDAQRYERFAAAAEDFLEVAHADGIRRPAGATANVPVVAILATALALGACGTEWDRNLDPGEEGPHGVSMLDDLLQVRYPDAEFDELEAGFGVSPTWGSTDALPADVRAGDVYLAIGPALAYDSIEVGALDSFVAEGGTAFLAAGELSIALSRVIFGGVCLGDRYDLYDFRGVGDGDTLRTSRGRDFVLAPVTEYYGGDETVGWLTAYATCGAELNVLAELRRRGLGPATEVAQGAEAGVVGDSLRDDVLRDGGTGDSFLTDGTTADDKAYLDSVLAEGAYVDYVEHDDGRRPLLIEVPHGEGHFLLLSAPILLANAYLADTSNRAAVEAVVGYLGPDVTRVTYDVPRRSSVYSVERANTPPSERPAAPPGEEGLLRELLRRPPLAAAYYLLLGGILTFVLFGAKRLQRIVPVIQPARNTTLAYLGNVSRLYLARPNNGLMARKQLGLFEAFCVRKFGLRPVHEPADRERLAELRGVDPTLVESLARYQHTVAHGKPLSNDAFLRLMHILRALYGQLGRRSAAAK